MAKRKLLQWMRDQLNSHAERVVIPLKEKAALDTAYAKASGLIAKVVQQKYPVADMKVLAKYKAAAPDFEIKVQFPNGVVSQFRFEADDAPRVPDHFEARNRIYLLDQKQADAAERWLSTSEAYKAERKKRLAAYKALTQGASYVEDIVELWPEAAKIIPQTALPIALGPKEIALVKADLRERAAA